MILDYGHPQTHFEYDTYNYVQPTYMYVTGEGIEHFRNVAAYLQVILADNERFVHRFRISEGYLNQIVSTAAREAEYSRDSGSYVNALLADSARVAIFDRESQSKINIITSDVARSLQFIRDVNAYLDRIVAIALRDPIVYDRDSEAYLQTIAADALRQLLQDRKVEAYADKIVSDTEREINLNRLITALVLPIVGDVTTLNIIFREVTALTKNIVGDTERLFNQIRFSESFLARILADPTVRFLDVGRSIRIAKELDITLDVLSKDVYDILNSNQRFYDVSAKQSKEVLVINQLKDSYDIYFTDVKKLDPKIFSRAELDYIRANIGEIGTIYKDEKHIILYPRNVKEL